MPESGANATADPSPLQASFLASGVFILALLLLFHETTWSMVSIWMRSDTYAHGFIILPISLWLVWGKRQTLISLCPQPALWVVLLLFPLGLVWVLAWLVDVLVVQQLALVAMLIVGVWAIVGHQLARALAFPLLFLFCAVPMGEALVPSMMEFTATSTIWMIQQTGIPVYREGLYFTLPSGSWSVVEACSGSRYLIASVTLGMLYAYLSYRSFWRRFLFLLASVIVPIIANTLRAYMIVMLGHLSEMRIATGVDHLLYGWVFFGLVIFLLFWIGSFFIEDTDQIAAHGSARVSGPVTTTSQLLVTLLITLMLAAMWPLLADTMESRPAAVPQMIILPAAAGEWRSAQAPGNGLQPDSAVAGQVAAYYDFNGQTLGLFVQYADGSAEEGEVVGSSTQFVVGKGGMRVLGRSRPAVQMGDSTVVVDEAQLIGPSGQQLAWSWYSIGGHHISNDYLAKLYEARVSLGMGSPGIYRIVIALPQQDSIAAPRALLQQFLDTHGPEIDRALRPGAEAEQ